MIKIVKLNKNQTRLSGSAWYLCKYRGPETRLMTKKDDECFKKCLSKWYDERLKDRDKEYNNLKKMGVSDPASMLTRDATIYLVKDKFLGTIINASKSTEDTKSSSYSYYHY